MTDRVENLCGVMHDAYEQAAVGAGWETQKASRKPWADVPEANKATMRAAVQALLNELDKPPLAAQAWLRPCELYVNHGSATPVITQGHHLHPQYMQMEVYGEIRDLELLYVCGTCHDSIHAWLYWLTGARALPQSHVPQRAQERAAQAYRWYIKAKAEKAA